MIAQRTQLLAWAALLSGGIAAFSYVRMDHQRDAALAAERDHQIVHRDLADLTSAGGAGRSVVPGRFDPREVSRRLNTAAVVAGIPEPKDTDPNNPPVRLGNTDYSEQPVIRRFEGITLQQLTRYLHELAITDPSSRAKSVELSPPETPPASGSGELWTADVSIAYLTYAPKETRSGR